MNAGEREGLRQTCELDGDWGGTEWGNAILVLLDALDAAERKIAAAEDTDGGAL